MTLASANIPASGDCEIVFNVMSATAGTYVSTLGTDALITGPAGGNTAAASASLTVTAASGGGGGGGALSWWDVLLLTVLLLAGRGYSAVVFQSPTQASDTEPRRLRWVLRWGGQGYGKRI